MEFTTYQFLALFGAVSGVAVVAVLGYVDGLRSSKQTVRALRWDLKRLQNDHHQLQLEHSISRRDAALALEVLTEERDTAQADAAALRLRLITTREQLETLQAQQQERAA